MLLFALLSCAQAGQIILSPEQSQHKTFTRSHPVALDQINVDGLSHVLTSGYSLAYNRPFPLPLIQPAMYYDLSNVKLKTKRSHVWRPRNAPGGSDSYSKAREASMRDSRGQPHPNDYQPLEWDELEVEAPDTSDMATLGALARMSSNAYLSSDRSSSHDKEWYDAIGRFNLSDSFGWTEDGVRGHVFATDDNSTVVVAIKGTSAGALIGGGGTTQINDKTNDNLLFSCCCARIDWSWSTVCDCYSGGWKCDQGCVEQALIDKSVYYPLATDLYNNITAQYPNANIWLTGHSLGGSLASLLGLTFGVPCVTFEAVADRMAAKRLHLPMPPGRPDDSAFGAITQVYHTADPIPQGQCVGSLSTCGIAGFALESKCHSGQTIVFDTVSALGWSLDIRTHGIVNVIEKVLKEDWDVKSAAGSSWWPGRRRDRSRGDDDRSDHRSSTNVPLAKTEQNCSDCERWHYGDFK